MLESYKNAIKRFDTQVSPIAHYYGKSKAYFWFHALLDHIRYGVTPNQYIGFRFFAKNSLEKRRFYTIRHSKKFERLLNSSEHYETFWNKALFNSAFREFIHRDWLLCESGGGYCNKRVYIVS